MLATRSGRLRAAFVLAEVSALTVLPAVRGSAVEGTQGKVGLEPSGPCMHDVLGIANSGGLVETKIILSAWAYLCDHETGATDVGAGDMHGRYTLNTNYKNANGECFDSGDIHNTAFVHSISPVRDDNPCTGTGYTYTNEAVPSGIYLNGSGSPSPAVQPGDIGLAF
jgi:hypothetical protein